MHVHVVFQVLKKISSYIQEQNEKVYAPRGLLLTDPIERGMRVVSFGRWRLRQDRQTYRRLTGDEQGGSRKRKNS